MSSASVDSVNHVSSGQKNRWPLLIILAVGFVPLLIAWFLYSQRILVPEQRTYHGDYFSHLPIINELNFEKRKWSIWFKPAQSCDQLCQQRWFEIVQIHKLLHKDIDRMQLGLVLGSADEALLTLPDYGEQKHLTTTRLKQIIGELLPITSLSESLVLVVDPASRLVFSYSTDVDAENILKDIKHLLKHN